MALLRISDAKKLSATDRKQKLAELTFELTKASNKASQSKGKRKELKRAIARLHTINNAVQGGENK